ncbi:MAG: hypothetical protein GX597_05705, partial [Anaerolineaceae bacterium]|nr:hypothetical protein [Anaerolineaceae bacterium]
MLIRRMAVLLVALLFVAACAGTPEPSPEATAGVGAQPAETQAPRPAATATVAATAASPTAQPSPGPAAAAAEESPWPVLLREVDFRVPAGNSYGPRWLALDAGQGRLYARTYHTAQPNTGLVTML